MVTIAHPAGHIIHLGRWTSKVVRLRVYSSNHLRAFCVKTTCKAVALVKQSRMIGALQSFSEKMSARTDRLGRDSIRLKAS